MSDYEKNIPYIQENYRGNKGTRANDTLDNTPMYIYQGF